MHSGLCVAALVLAFYGHFTVVVARGRQERKKTAGWELLQAPPNHRTTTRRFVAGRIAPGGS